MNMSEAYAIAEQWANGYITLAQALVALLAMDAFEWAFELVLWQSSIEERQAIAWEVK